jgi:hypothetical protein
MKHEFTVDVEQAQTSLAKMCKRTHRNSLFYFELSVIKKVGGIGLKMAKETLHDGIREKKKIDDLTLNCNETFEAGWSCSACKSL